jgi:hypothetical protein
MPYLILFIFIHKYYAYFNRYHIYCVGLRKVPTGRWHCVTCSVCHSCNANDPNPDDRAAEWHHEVIKFQTIHWLKFWFIDWFIHSFCFLVQKRRKGFKIFSAFTLCFLSQNIQKRSILSDLLKMSFKIGW